jgi:tRNA(fMet)-specific endonuclease VapC
LSQTTTSYLLDTSVLVHLLQGDPLIQQRFSTVGIAYVSSIALGELFYGANLSNQTAQGIADIHTLAQTLTIFVPDMATAELYGTIKQRLRAAGQMIPENDIWIAATAIQHQLAIATRDAHFSRVAGLQVMMW